MKPFTAAAWNEQIARMPAAHILQTWEWAQFKASYGWQPLPQVVGDQQGDALAAAMVLRRAIPGGLNMLYAPRGPLLDWGQTDALQAVLERLERLSREQKSIFVKIDPELILAFGAPGSADERAHPVGMQAVAELKARGWRLSAEQVQFRNTVWLDLSGDEADWLARMKQKTRYNIRLAERKGVRVRTGGVEDLPRLYRMYAETSVRDGFVIRGEEYYLTLWRTFLERGLAEPLIAEVEGEPVAGILLFYFAGRAWYLYGMSREAHREKMPNYLLQWEAMRRAKALGCGIYDLWGAPDVFDESDSMWGVYRFKEGLGGQVVRTAGAWDFPARPLFYFLYTRVLPRVLDVMRRRGKARTRQEVSL